MTTARAQALAAIKPADIQAYIPSLAADGLSPATRARKLSAVRQLYKFLAAEGIVADDPSIGLAGPKRGRSLPRTLSVAEVDRLIATARARKDYPKDIIDEAKDQGITHFVAALEAAIKHPTPRALPLPPFKPD